MTRLALPIAVASAPDLAASADVPPLLRLLTCGSVDDGKSTLIGRLLADCGAVPDDQREALARDSARQGHAGAGLDYALLVDGLEDERAQGITIDVAWRSFATARRRFILADAPGHAQYTRNMATAASTCDLAVVLVDAVHGVRPQTLRHAQIAALLGIRALVLAVNKMDLALFAQARFAAIERDFAGAVARHAFAAVHAIPVVARDGDNVARRSPRMAWHRGPTLLDVLETTRAQRDAADGPFRMAVQHVVRDAGGARLYCGTVAAGAVRPGDRLAVAPGGGAAVVARIARLDGDRDHAGAGQAVTLAMEATPAIARGDVLASAAAPLAAADGLAAHLVWLSDARLVAGRSYLLKLATRTVAATITRIAHRLDVETGQHLAADALDASDVGLVEVALAAPLAFEPYARSRVLGGFILIDRASNATVGVGMVEAARPSAGVVWHPSTIDRAARARLLGQTPAVVWLTGLSGAGKSTIANLVERHLHAQGRHTYLLDGDNVRHGLSRDLGFSEADRVENIRRAAEVARLMADAGLIVLVSFISPYRADRAMARARLAGVAFLEAWVDASVDACARRDTKGLYARARAGEIAEFTGVNAPYEPPERPELHLPTDATTPEAMAARVVAAVQALQ